MCSARSAKRQVIVPSSLCRVLQVMDPFPSSSLPWERLRSAKQARFEPLKPSFQTSTTQCVQRPGHWQCGARLSRHQRACVTSTARIAVDGNPSRQCLNRPCRPPFRHPSIVASSVSGLLRDIQSHDRPPPVGVKSVRRGSSGFHPCRESAKGCQRPSTGPPLTTVAPSEMATHRNREVALPTFQKAPLRPAGTRYATRSETSNRIGKRL